MEPKAGALLYPREFVAPFAFQFSERLKTGEDIHNYLFYDRGTVISVMVAERGSVLLVNFAGYTNTGFIEFTQSQLRELEGIQTIGLLCEHCADNLSTGFYTPSFRRGSTYALILYAIATGFKHCRVHSVICMPACKVVVLTEMAQLALDNGLPEFNRRLVS